jgi:hypothetical protein
MPPTLPLSCSGSRLRRARSTESGRAGAPLPGCRRTRPANARPDPRTDVGPALRHQGRELHVPRNLLRRRAVGLPVAAPADTQDVVRRTVRATLDEDPLNAPSGCIDHGHVPTVAVRRCLWAGKGASPEPTAPFVRAPGDPNSRSSAFGKTGPLEGSGLFLEAKCRLG